MAEGGVLMEPIKGQPCVFLPYLRQAEDAIAEAVRRLEVGRPPRAGMNADKGSFLQCLDRLPEMPLHRPLRALPIN
jgi:hypothetical protein